MLDYAARPTRSCVERINSRTEAARKPSSPPHTPPPDAGNRKAKAANASTESIHSSPSSSAFPPAYKSPARRPAGNSTSKPRAAISAQLTSSPAPLSSPILLPRDGHRGLSPAQHPPAGAAPDPASGVVTPETEQQQPRGGRHQEVPAGLPETPRQEGSVEARGGGVRRAGVLDVPRAERPSAAAVPRQEGRGGRRRRRRRRDARPQAHPAAGVARLLVVC